METTFADIGSGGAFSENYIPELTQISEANEDFTGEEDVLGGAVSYAGTTFTMGALFGQTTGLPLKIGIGVNNMDTQDSFFPGVTALGDILKDQGYRQVFLCGSQAEFGGRRLFFETHGEYEIRDYNYAIEQGLIPSDYKVFWGYEDEKLFSIAKETLLELAQGDEPFNLTMLTVDTHFPDGYVCDLCREDYGDNQYANVLACSSRQILGFLDWIQEQDFYENTTVILQGDHPTMYVDFLEGINPDYRRKAYTTYVNAAVRPQDAKNAREYSTMDNFPTTLAALGVKIEGDRLGLGTNLFSGVQTLTEEYGDSEVGMWMNARSAFLEEKEKTNPLSGTLIERYRDIARNHLTIESYDSDTGDMNLKMVLNYHGGPKVKSYIAVASETDGSGVHETVMEPSVEKNTFYGKLNLSDWKALDGSIRVELHLESGQVLEDLVTIYLSDLMYLHDDYNAYLKCLKEDPRFADMSVLFAAKDDATGSLTEENIEAMEALGLKQAGEIAGQSRISYAAVAEKGEAVEKAGYEELTLSGVLRDGETSYEITSGGHDYGNHVDLKINGMEYAVDHTGMNIVVYDPARKTVVDSVRFKISK